MPCVLLARGLRVHGEWRYWCKDLLSWRHAVGALSARVAGRAGHHLAYIGAEIAISRDELSLGQEIQIADRH